MNLENGTEDPVHGLRKETDALTDRSRARIHVPRCQRWLPVLSRFVRAPVFDCDERAKEQTEDQFDEANTHRHCRKSFSTESTRKLLSATVKSITSWYLRLRTCSNFSMICGRCSTSNRAGQSSEKLTKAAPPCACVRGLSLSSSIDRRPGMTLA